MMVMTMTMLVSALIVFITTSVFLSVAVIVTAVATLIYLLTTVAVTSLLTLIAPSLVAGAAVAFLIASAGDLR